MKCVIYICFQLMAHMRTHVTEALHRCSHCDAEFKMKTNLDWHIKTTHPQVNYSLQVTKKTERYLSDKLQKIKCVFPIGIILFI